MQHWSGGIRIATFAAWLAGITPVQAHNDHMLVGHNADGRLAWHPDPAASVQHDAMIVLNLIPPGGPIAGFSAAIPGYSMVLTASPEQDIYPPAAGADIWVRILQVDAPLLMIETPSYRIVNALDPPEMRVGSGAQTHVHPLWLLDTQDPAFDPSRCIWEITFVLEDKGSTHYLPSVPITYRFVAGAVPSPADFDCDGDVDAADLDLLNGCASGPAIPYDPGNLPSTCPVSADHQGFIRPDLDRDGDVDQSDFGLFQRHLPSAPPGAA